MAAKQWSEVVPQLERLGHVTELESSALFGLCRWYSIWRAADQRLRDDSGYKAMIAAQIS